MQRVTLRTGLWATAIAVIAGAAVLAQSPPAWTSISEERLREPAPGDWMSYRRTDDVTAFSPLRQIDRTTVRRLQPVWTYSMRDNRRWLATPIVANGLMYVPEGSGRVVAFDAVSGEVVWIHERQFPADIAISEGYARTRGVSIYRDTLYWGTPDSYLIALDARTGALRWEVKTGDYRIGAGHAHPPLVAEGKVFLGHAGGDNGAPGRFRAFDAETGMLLWTVNTAPGPGDPGYDTWTRRDVPPLGGAPWNTVSYDPDLRLVYFSTGQPAPWSTALRGQGDALYTNTVLAVDAQTGKIRWHFQLNPADDWDRAGYENMLVDLQIGGRTRKALIQTGKMGWGVVLDRETGEFLHAFKTAYDNVVTGWTQKGRPIVNPALIPPPADVDSGKVSGLVYLLARGDEVHVETLGVTRYDGTEPMRRDTIFRIASLTKPVTAVAVMMLVEEGKVSLDEPAERLLPELANHQVLTVRHDLPISRSADSTTLGNGGLGDATGGAQIGHWLYRDRSPVPEPSTLTILAAAIAAGSATLRRRRHPPC